MECLLTPSTPSAETALGECRLTGNRFLGRENREIIQTDDCGNFRTLTGGADVRFRWAVWVAGKIMLDAK